MKTKDVVVGEQYLTADRMQVVTVLSKAERICGNAERLRHVAEFHCLNERTGRTTFKTARQLGCVYPKLTAEQAMDALVAYADGGSVPTQEQLRASFVAMVVEQKPACARPTVVSYTADGLPIPG
jgi:hypothetical protein